MPIQHKNRKGQTYYLHRSIAKSGKPRYFFSRKSEGDLVQSLPDGYEIYENPNSQVYLRRERPKVMTDEEIALVKNEIRQHAWLEHYLLDVKKNAIIVFEPNEDLNGLTSLFNAFGGLSKIETRKTLSEFLSYAAVMRFILVDSAKRVFVAERYCYRGSIDDWIEIGKPGRLQDLVSTYIKHLGQETFFELQ